MPGGFWDRQLQSFVEELQRRPIVVDAGRLALTITFSNGIVDLFMGRDLPFSQVLISLAISYPVALVVLVAFRWYAMRRLRRLQA